MALRAGGGRLRRPVWDMGRLRRTTTFRLTTILGLLFAGAILLLLGLVYVQTASYLTWRVDHQLTMEVKTFSDAGPELILQRFRRASVRDPLSAFGLFTSSGEQVAGDSRVRPSDLDAYDTPQNVGGHGGAPPGRALKAILPWGETLIVERDTSQLLQLRRIILGAFLWSGAGIAGLGLACAVTLSLRPLRRVRAFQDASEAIVAGDFSVRLPVDGSRDELDELAGIVNTMMNEVERLVIQARTVGEGVAHELRTPLTRLRATLDHARQLSAGPKDPRDALLDRCAAETEAMLVRFQALLRIAAVEARARRAAIAPTSLSTAVTLVGELYQPLADERAIAFEVHVEPDVEAPGDPDLLVEAVSNLLDNALKFTPSGGAVRLSLVRTSHGPVIEVRDTGPGIPENERLLVTQRFFRGQRQAGVEGHGLGLSLVSAVAELHGMELSIGDASPGAVIRLSGRAEPDWTASARGDHAGRV